MVKKLEKKGIQTLDLANYLPEKKDIVQLDLKPYLFKEMILKEKDFRSSLDALEIEAFEGKIVSVICSNNAIIPTWAYMLVAAKISPVAAYISASEGTQLLEEVIWKNFQNEAIENYIDARIVIKGCGEVELSPDIYIKITAKLQPVARAVMFGEPCSTVPVYRKK